jgi:hypothetical protein
MRLDASAGRRASDIPMVAKFALTRAKSDTCAAAAMRSAARRRVLVQRPPNLACLRHRRCLRVIAVGANLAGRSGPTYLNNQSIIFRLMALRRACCIAGTNTRSAARIGIDPLLHDPAWARPLSYAVSYPLALDGSDRFYIGRSGKLSNTPARVRRFLPDPGAPIDAGWQRALSMPQGSNPFIRAIVADGEHRLPGRGLLHHQRHARIRTCSRAHR